MPPGCSKSSSPTKDDGALLEAVELSLGDMELAGSLLNEPKTLALYRHGAQMVKDGVFFSPFACLEGLAVFEKERDAFLHLLPYWAEQMGLIGRRCAQNGVEGRYTAQKCAKSYMHCLPIAACGLTKTATLVYY